MKKVVLGFLLFALLGFWQFGVHAAIIINEVLADPAADADGDGVVSSTKDEFVELANTDAAIVSVANWTIADALSVRHTFGSDAVISGYGFLTVFGGLALNNTGDTVTLKDADQTVVDTWTFGPEGGKDVALTRLPDGTGSFVAHPALGGVFFSPGTTLDGVSHLPFPVTEEPVPDPVPDPDPLPDPHDFPTEIPNPIPGEPSTPIVPEPATWMLFGIGASSFLARKKRDV